jgi:hypothetical protein
MNGRQGPDIGMCRDPLVRTWQERSARERGDWLTSALWMLQIVTAVPITHLIHWVQKSGRMLPRSLLSPLERSSKAQGSSRGVVHRSRVWGLTVGLPDGGYSAGHEQRSVSGNYQSSVHWFVSHGKAGSTGLVI